MTALKRKYKKTEKEKYRPEDPLRKIVGTGIKPEVESKINLNSN